MNCIKVSYNKKVSTVQLEDIKDLELIHTFKFDDESVELYGCLEGREKYINQLDLPYEVGNILLYNDLYFCSKNNDNYTPLHSDEFDNLYESLFGGFYDIEDTDDEDISSDDDYDYNDGFIIKD